MYKFKFEHVIIENKLLFLFIQGSVSLKPYSSLYEKKSVLRKKSTLSLLRVLQWTLTKINLKISSIPCVRYQFVAQIF